jgi:hypothetical protein
MQQPRQLYGLGSLVKSVTKAVKKVVKSPVGKAAILGFGGAGLMGMGPLSGLAGLLPAKGAGKFLFSPVQGSGGGGLFGKILGSKKAVTGLIGGASLLSGLFAGKTEEEVEQLKRDPAALRNYLKLYYSNLNPNASSEEVDRFADANMYSDGGRVGYDDGGSAYDRLEEKIKELMDQGLSRELAEALAESGLSKEAYTIPEKKSAGGRVGYAVGSPGPASPRIRPTGGALSRAPAPGTMPSPFAPAAMSTPLIKQATAPRSFIPKAVPRAIPLPKAVPAGGPSAKTVSQLGSAQGATPLFQNVLQYLQRSGQQVTPKPKQPAQPATPKPMPFDMSRYGQGIFTGGIEDTRNIALARLMGLGYDTSRFADPMGPPPGSSSGPMIIGPGMAAKFRDEENLAKLINPSYGMQLQTDVVGLLSMAKDLGENYTIDQALNFDKDDAMRIIDAHAKKNKYGKYAPRSSANILPKFPGTTTPPASQFPTQRGTGSKGRGINYATGGSVVDQASGIMNLPKRVNKAGVKELDLRKSGGFIPPVGVKEKADDIPAMLSNNEFVFTADAVRGMGNGNVNLGAQRMYDMMKKLEKGGRA